MANDQAPSSCPPCRITFEELALNAEEVGKILGYAGRTVLEQVACKPSFPARLTSTRPHGERGTY